MMDHGGTQTEQIMTLGRLLKSFRIEVFGLSLAKFGALIGFSGSTYQRYEHNDFGKNFANNRNIKLRSIAECIARLVFDRIGQNEASVKEATQTRHISNQEQFRSNQLKAIKPQQVALLMQAVQIAWQSIDVYAEFSEYAPENKHFEQKADLADYLYWCFLQLTANHQTDIQHDAKSVGMVHE
jgi:hypothetical protein